MSEWPYLASREALLICKAVNVNMPGMHEPSQTSSDCIFKPSCSLVLIFSSELKPETAAGVVSPITQGSYSYGFGYNA